MLEARRLARLVLSAPQLRSLPVGVELLHSTLYSRPINMRALHLHAIEVVQLCGSAEIENQWPARLLYQNARER